MLHHYVEEGSSAHYGVSTDGFGKMLIQVGDIYGDQSRVALTIEEAEQFMAKFAAKLAEAKAQPSLEQFLIDHKDEPSLAKHQGAIQRAIQSANVVGND